MKIDTSNINSSTRAVIDTINPSLFQEHLLNFKNSKPIIHFTDYDYGVTAILFFLYVLYIWLYVTNSKRLNQVIKGFYVYRHANQLAREEVSLGNRVSVFLGILFVFTLALFLTQINIYYGYVDVDAYMLFFFLSIGILVAYSIKLIVIKILAFIFKVSKEANEYSLSIFLFANVLGLFMFPVVICLLFLKQLSPTVFIYMGMILITLFVFIRLVRAIIVGLNSVRVSKFYLFLYICSLEILPFVIAVKLFALYDK